jgi:squalene-associated FAD-dependent desaturase
MQHSANDNSESQSQQVQSPEGRTTAQHALRSAAASRAMRGEPGVVVVGGGLAGLACAVRLAERRIPALVLEARRRLGGRASSAVDGQSGEEIDNCQHVTLGCCDRYLALLRTLGVLHTFAFSDEQWWRTREGRLSHLRPSSWLPARVSMLPALLASHFLSPKAKLDLARACAAAAVVEREAMQHQSFAQWLDAHDQGEQVREHLWTPLIVSACNATLEATSAASALHVVQGAVLPGPHASRIGLPTTPLRALYDPAREIISRVGGAVVEGAAVSAIDRDASGLVVRVGSAEVRARCVVVATPFEKATGLLESGAFASDPRVEQMRGLSHSPILGLHMRFDRRVMHEPHAVMLGTGVQWAFRKDDAGCLVHAVVSAADAWMNLSGAEIETRALADVRACFPLARVAKLERCRAVKERFATFVPSCSSHGHRARTAHEASPGLLLAGDHTDTGWPATMEGAVRSGEAAARAVVRRFAG